ncbi:unnamed protein product [Durusdinium trenchii]|uniref:Uncharacterized protein n=1 Tax=Durusdinium trenchii TaxID=1381693 RepID=A0ABP0SEA6_9DINO
MAAVELYQHHVRPSLRASRPCAERGPSRQGLAKPVLATAAAFWSRLYFDRPKLRCRVGGEPEMWKEPSKEELAAAAAEMDEMAPFRNTVGFLGLLLLGKALPDAVFAVLRNWAGIRGAEKLDYAMLGADALFSAVGRISSPWPLPCRHSMTRRLLQI